MGRGGAGRPLRGAGPGSFAELYQPGRAERLPRLLLTHRWDDVPEKLGGLTPPYRRYR